MVNAFFSIYLVSLDAPAGLVGSAWALGAIVEVPLMIAFPALAQRFGVSRLVVVGAGFLLLRGIVVVLSADPLIVVGSFALHGAGYALLLVGGVTYVAAQSPRGSAATAQGVLAGVVTGLAQAIGPGVAGVIAGATSIHTMFIVAAVASTLGVVAVAFAVATRARQAEVRPLL
jgi:PPP family 3-phenylpropionic acid transporter